MKVETSRVLLRFLTKNDADNLIELDSDPDVMKYISNGVPSTKDDVDRAIERALLVQSRHDGQLGYWAVIEKSTGAFMGWFMLRPPLADPFNCQRVELGYRLKKRYWGVGHATEIARALIERRLEVSSGEEIFAIAGKGNEASQAILRKVGLVYNREYESRDFSEEMKTVVEYILKKS